MGDEIQKMIQRAEVVGGKKGASLGFSESRDLLRVLRNKYLRRPDLVVRHGVPLLKEARKLGDELWTVHEQVCKAALDVAADDVFLDSLEALLTRFPGSTRVKLLQAMALEADHDWAEAEISYASILEEHPENLTARKRQVAVLKAQGKTAAAIKALNAIVDIFQSDAESWLELADLHSSINNLEQAAFCFEEVVLLRPIDASMHTHLGELYYTISCSGSASQSAIVVSSSSSGGGGKSPSGASLLMARKHFSQSLTLQEAGNYRAMHGLCAACTALATLPKRGSGSGGKGGIVRDDHEEQVNMELHRYASTLLQKAYQTAPKGMAEIIMAVSSAQNAWISDAMDGLD